MWLAMQSGFGVSFLDTDKLLAVKAALGQSKLPKVKILQRVDEETGVAWQGDPALVNRWGGEAMQLRRLRPESEENGEIGD